MNDWVGRFQMDPDGHVGDLAEIHASSSGLKGLCCVMAADGIEDMRRACGGHGYLLCSGVAQLGADYVWQATAEGDYIVLSLQTARFLVGALRRARAGEPLSGLARCLSGLRENRETDKTDSGTPNGRAPPRIPKISHTRRGGPRGPARRPGT